MSELFASTRVQAFGPVRSRLQHMVQRGGDLGGYMEAVVRSVEAEALIQCGHPEPLVVLQTELLYDDMHQRHLLRHQFMARRGPHDDVVAHGWRALVDAGTLPTNVMEPEAFMVMSRTQLRELWAHMGNMVADVIHQPEVNPLLHALLYPVGLDAPVTRDKVIITVRADITHDIARDSWDSVMRPLEVTPCDLLHTGQLHHKVSGQYPQPDTLTLRSRILNAFPEKNVWPFGRFRGAGRGERADTGAGDVQLWHEEDRSARLSGRWVDEILRVGAVQATKARQAGS